MGNDGKSPSSRRAWIEIYSHKHSEQHKGVALLAEGVDRNKTGLDKPCFF